MARQRNPSPLVAASRKGKGRAGVGLGRAPSGGTDELMPSISRGRDASGSTASLKDLDISGHAGNVNLGNTCFLNSVLQAAAVTIPLQELLEHQWDVLKQGRDRPSTLSDPPVTVSEWTDHESDEDDGTPEGVQASIQRRRRRAAAKGKAKACDAGVIMPELPLGTREAPLSDAFRTHLSRAYTHRPATGTAASSPSTSRKKSSANAYALNPRPLLNALARKFDQYGDFAQQDAHELLRHLLDACRMEEVDLIKKLKAERERAKAAGEEAPPLPTQAQSQQLPRTEADSTNQESGKPRRSPRLIKPSPIPAHIRTEGSGSDASDTDIVHAGGLQPLCGSGELTPMPNPRTATGNHVQTFFPDSESATGGGIDTRPQGLGDRQKTKKADDIEFKPLIDVVFGGQLASIIVCESCRNVRHTYEDFYDISLPLRDESGHKVSDKARKKDRIRSMSELWRRAPPTSVASSSANDARALIAKAQMAHDEADDTVVMGKRRGSVAAMSETEVSETDATPGLMDRRRQKAEARRRASISGTKDKISAAGGESSAGEDRARVAGNVAGGGKSIFRTGSIRRSLGHLSKSSKESVVSAHISDAAPGSPNGAAGNNVVEGLERAVASMALSPSAQTAVLSSDADIPNVPLPPQQQQPSTSPAIFSFWKSARNNSKSPAPSATSAGFSLIDSPEFRSRSTSPRRGHNSRTSGDALTRPASTVPDHLHLAPPPANAHAFVMVQKDGQSAATDTSTSSLQLSPAAPIGLMTAEGTPLSQPSPSASPMASLLSRTKAPPSSGFTPPSSNQTSPAVLATRFVSGTKLQHSTKADFRGRAPRRGPSRQAQYLAKILADVAAPEDKQENGGAGAPLSAVQESPVDGPATKTVQRSPSRARSPSAATALLKKMNGHGGDGLAGATNGQEKSKGEANVPPSAEVIAAEFETGLGQALCQFTKVELLEGDNAFKCRRCWRIAHPRTMQERQRRREKERQRKLREAQNGRAGNKADEEEDEDDDKRDSSETPSSDLDTSDEDVDAALELPPSLNRPALTRNNLQMNATKLEAASPDSSRRSSIDSEALQVMGASILSAPGKLGEGTALQGQIRRPRSALEPLPSIPSIRMSVPTGSNAGDMPEPKDEAGASGDRPAAAAMNATLSASSADKARSASLEQSSSNQGSTINPGGRGSNGSSQKSVNTSSASISPRESIESLRPQDARRRSDGDDEMDDEVTARPDKTTFGPQIKGGLNGAGSATVSTAPAPGKAATGPRDKKAAAAKAAKKATEFIERRALKRYLIASAPPVLVFHFKRFQSNTARFGGRRSRPGDFSKIDDPVSFPEFFDVSPWLAPAREEFNRLGGLKATSDPAVLARAQEEQGQFYAGSQPSYSLAHQVMAPKPPKSPFRFLRGQHPESPSTPRQEWYATAVSQKEATSRPHSLYGLYAVVNHQGNMSGGHYTAYVLSDRVRSKAPKGDARKPETAKGPTSRSHSRQVSATSSYNQIGQGSSNASEAMEQDATVQEANGRGHSAPQKGPTRASERVESDNRQWLHVSDATVRPATASEVYSSKYVYMLFYERL
ncbi:hypothetical protein CF327_g4017 [Tilletia walkeri]|nr:hypothetical protein CF327_g4017 [Tilletia walkeri]